MIHSIYTIPEETSLVRPNKLPSLSPSSLNESDYERKWDQSDIPQQLHVSKLPSGSLSLGPGQVAIVPVTFLPRYPSLIGGKQTKGGYKQNNNHQTTNNKNNNNIDDYYATTVSDGRSPPPLSSTAKVDLLDFVGERVLKAIDDKRQYLRHTLDPTYRRRNNIVPSSLPKGDEEYEVSTTVVVDTSRGIVKLPITATSVRGNSYRVPDVIKFHHPSLTKEGDENGDDDYDADDDDVENDASCHASGSATVRGNLLKKRSCEIGGTSFNGILIMDTLHATDRSHPGDEKANRASVLDTIKPEKECFDLHLSNPFHDRELQIIEVLISRPEFVSLQFDPTRQAALDKSLLVRTGPSQVLRQWTEDGPLHLAPDSDNHYILSICTAFEGEIERDEGSETYLDEMSKWIDSGDPNLNLGFLQIRTDAETLFIGLEHAENATILPLVNESYHDSESQNISKTLTSVIPSMKNSTHSKPGSSTLLKSHPDRLDFDMISTTSPALYASFGLQNKSPAPIRIMRVTVGFDSHGDEEKAREAKLIGLKLDIGVRLEGRAESDDNNYEKDDQIDSLILGAASSLDDILVLKCSLNPDRYFSDSNKEAFHFSATLVLRGTMDTELSYTQWREETLRDPYRDEHLTIELPITISILNGRVEALIERSSHPYPQLFAAQSWDGSGRAVSHLFFPLNRYAAVTGTEDVLPKQMYLGTNEIRHDLRILSNLIFPLKLVGAKILDDDDTDDKDSLCNRFNVTTAQPSDPDNLYFGFEEIGLLSLKYKFSSGRGKKGEKEKGLLSSDHPHIPKRCIMDVMTNPTEGGNFQIPLLIFPGILEISSTSSSTSIQNNAIVGINHFLSWCRSSLLGKSFLEVIEKSFDERRKSKSDYSLLLKYMSQNSQWDQKLKPNFHPILLKVGAVDSGEIVKMHIYMTNHNPIPLTVSIDVGEVEGMSITLSREASQLTGDGNSLVDFLPKQEKSPSVNLGKYRDHPVAALSEFLTSNEEALEFISKFNYRDSLSPYYPAIERSHVLQLLHDWHSKAFFHREEFSSRIKSKGSTMCESDLHPPLYNSFNKPLEPTKTGKLFGSFILSSDKRLARPLKECWKRDPDHMSSDRGAVKIPPGARARFEVQVRSPPQNDLKDDISHLLVTGLVLSTNIGIVMPIFAVIEALQGQLHASQVQQLNSQYTSDFVASRLPDKKRNIMKIPLDLSWIGRQDPGEKSNVNSTSITIPPANFSTPLSSNETLSYFFGDGNISQGVPLYLKSSFSRNVRILDVESCNPWFKVVPLNRNAKFTKTGTIVGFIRTNIDCSLIHSTYSGFPSFYQCMLNWLSHRLELQTESCGLKDSNNKLQQIKSVKKTMEVGLRRLKKSYRINGLFGLNYDGIGTSPLYTPGLSYIKTGRRKNDGTIKDFDSYDTIWKALKKADDFGYNLLSSSLRATVEYDSETSNEFDDSQSSVAKQNLTLSIKDLAIQSVLKAPKLFDSDDDYLEFRSTLVGSVTSAVIAVRNPTGLPVRVRLGTAPSKESNVNKRNEALAFNSQSDTHQIEKLLQSPYVQNGRSRVPSNGTMSFLWWDGNGGFFIANEEGDVIRSHHNISIIRGSGSTSISMINPSLQSQVGFLVGCGTRCGLKDKSYLDVALNHPVSKSPIGASAASGITLTGHIRPNSIEENGIAEAESVILAAGTLPDTGGPSAFAIPFSALDEIVIPPFGIGQLGPIYFRPPGRHKMIGCDVARKSGTRLDREKQIICDAQSFDSVVYLENSLTGLEKVVLRGNSIWNHLYFVDPPPREGEDAFGDIEFRDGIPTLLFSGTSSPSIDLGSKSSRFGKKIKRISVIKEVVLCNGGDADSKVSGVYISGVNSDGEKLVSCSHGSFTILNCWDTISFSERQGNIHNEFILKPGENRSIFVEHYSDCRTNEEFITLRVQLHISNPIENPVFIPNRGRQSRSRSLHNPFLNEDTSIVLGYQMNEAAFAHCMPADSRLNSAVFYEDLKTVTPANFSSRIEMKAFGEDQEQRPLLLLQVILFSFAALLLCSALRTRFLDDFIGSSRKIKGTLTGTNNDRSSWNAAFRCLARSDPTSLDLQTMSREQIRQVVLGRYKAKGNTMSSSSNCANSFSRDRRAAATNNTRQRVGKEGGASTERIRPFSDAIFHDTSVAEDTSLRVYLPVGLGWRTAYSRGVIKDNSLQSTSFAMRTKVLLDQRASASLARMDKNFTESTKDKKKRVSKTIRIEEHNAHKYSASLPNEENGNKNDNANIEIVEAATVIPTSESEEIDANNPDSCYQTYYIDKNKNKSNGSSLPKDIIASVEKSESVLAVQQEVSIQTIAEIEKQKKKNDVTFHHNTSLHGTKVLKRNHKPKNQATKTVERKSFNKVDKFAPWGNMQQEKVAPKDLSDLLGPSPKLSSSNPWLGDQKYIDMKVSKRKQPGTDLKKSKPNMKQNKKADKKKKAEQVKPDSAQEERKLSKMLTNVVISSNRPTLTPPPGFDGTQTTVIASPKKKTVVPYASSTETEVSLETMITSALTGGSIDVNNSVDGPSQPRNSNLAFSKNISSGSDLIFSGNIRDSRLNEEPSENVGTRIENDFVFQGHPSPTTTRVFKNVDVTATSENNSALGPSVDQPWLPALLNEEPEPIEQPWLPTLHNEEAESGFDVMDFLDGILQDGSTTEDEQINELQSSVSSTPSRIISGNTTGTATTPVLANPWASEGKSRASAYGISFDDNDGGLNGLLKGASLSEGLSGELGENIPLLTPAAILSAEKSNSIVVDSDDKAVSFYDGLLDE